jgi:GGDEF domain-containing protein
MGIQFSSIEASDIQTLRYFIKSIYGLPSLTPRLLPETEEIHITDLLGAASTSGLPEFSPKALGCGDPAALNTRLTHEFHRTKRYNHEFSCIALRITHLGEPGSEEGLEETLVLLSEEIRGSVRNTDEVFYLLEGVFVILAPETMKNRVHTLSGRLTRNVLGVIEAKGFKSNDLEFKCGTFSFDGRNAKTHNDVLSHALDECLHSSLNSVM